MSFKTENYTKKAGKPGYGGRELIACDCWFTSSGGMQPRFLKWQSPDGEIHTVPVHTFLPLEDEHFAGRTQKVFFCTAEQNGTAVYFKLYYNVGECRWKMEWVKNS
uniref:hypothetical protein n=1 Tax=Lachnoclostridium phocaeense TaxID=1871021 RepID=UPI0026DAB282|nr:hypothetical protein [Lachnoclostridium phocaeense]